MRRVRGVAEQHHVAVRPRGVLYCNEVAPQRAVLEQSMAFELFLEQDLTKSDRLIFTCAIEPGTAPRGLGRLDDERRMPGLVLVGMHAPKSMLVALEVKRKGREGTRRAEPDEAIGPLIHGRLKVLRVSLPHRTVESVGAEDQIGIRVDCRVSDLRPHLDAHAQLFAMPGQVGEQLLSGKPAEAVTARLDDMAAKVNADVIPMEIFARQCVKGLGIRGCEIVLCRI